MADPLPEGSTARRRERERFNVIANLLARLPSCVRLLRIVDVAGTTLPVSSQLKSLGVIIDSHMRFDTHVGAVDRACNYHTHALRHVRKHPTTETASRHESTILQLTAVWCSCCSRREATEHKTTSPGSCVSSTYSVCDRATLLLKSLHWLPVQQRVQYKIAVITHKAVNSVPPYIDELLQLQVTAWSLRFTDAQRLSVP